jgi:cytidyltransferase-like protein
MEKVVCISGYFDPIHIGHLEYIELAKSLGDKLMVIVNNDEQAKLKKGSHFMEQNNRLSIVSSLKNVDITVLSIDQDRTVCETLRKYKPDIFANGGDQNNDNIPEKQICVELGIELVDNLGEKKESSRFLVKKASNTEYKTEWFGDKYEKINRQWGYYERILPSDTNYQIKRLTLLPNKSTSLQTHEQRKEFWVCVSGNGQVVVGEEKRNFQKDDHVKVEILEKHQIINTSDSEELILIEIQSGKYLGEDDIVRYS